MTYTEFLQLVTEMRQAQRSYFKTRTQGDLMNSKRLEKLTDNAIAEGKFPASAEANAQAWSDDTECFCAEQGNQAPDALDRLLKLDFPKNTNG